MSSFEMVTNLLLSLFQMTINVSGYFSNYDEKEINEFIFFKMIKIKI